VIRFIYFFHQHRPIGKLSVIPEILSRTKRGVSEVHLVSIRIEHYPCSKYFVMTSIVRRLANISCFIDRFIAVKAGRSGAAGLLRADKLIARQDDEHENDK